ncbi:hypothetical protein OEZ86_002655 [Tetradesmus obliquus]|nr:hypothetical protein OEZ86_002655 [Tetradesmus obliquus]
MGVSHQPKLKLVDALPIWWRIARQWFTGSAKWQARAYVLGCAVLACLTTWLAVQISYAQKHFSTGLAEKDQVAWKAAVWEFVGIICIAAPLKALAFYTEKRMIATWRAALSEALIMAYTSNSGASACVDNPDQRITNDVANYVSTSVTLVALLGKKALNCAAFAGVLWSISPRLVLFLLGYAFLGTFGTAAVFGRALTSLQQRILKLEADLRFGLVRLRENAEAIAFYGGDAREAADLRQRLAAMLLVLLRRISWLGCYELWVTAYSYATILLPSLVLAPEYFQGKIPFGTLTQASYAFQVLEGALGLILAKLDEFSSLAAETARLDGLLTALEAADVDAGGSGSVQGFEQPVAGAVGLLGGLGAGLRAGGLGSKRKKGPGKSEAGFCAEELSAWVPGRHHMPTCVCAELSFSIAPGESLLVLGPSGCGKSSLLRVIAGLWTVGSGTVRGPPPNALFFLPQKPFMPLGSLRQQLLFDSGLDTELDWSAVLSLGEQQRVALVRLLYHKPQLAFLDEATSALDPKSEAVVYGLVRQACSSYVSVGHRLQLLEWHSHVLVCCGQPGAGHWEKYTAAEYKQRLAAGLEG